MGHRITMTARAMAVSAVLLIPCSPLDILSGDTTPQIDTPDTAVERALAYFGVPRQFDADDLIRSADTLVALALVSDLLPLFPDDTATSRRVWWVTLDNIALRTVNSDTVSDTAEFYFDCAIVIDRETGVCMAVYCQAIDIDPADIREPPSRPRFVERGPGDFESYLGFANRVPETTFLGALAVSPVNSPHSATAFYAYCLRLSRIGREPCDVWHITQDYRYKVRVLSNKYTRLTCVINAEDGKPLFSTGSS